MLSYQIISPNEAHNDFFKLLETIVENRQVYIVNRDNGENVALIAESD
jgi:antitoxin YefM